MRAARVHKFGNIADVAIDNILEPVPSVDQVLVRVASAALNPIDYKVALTGHRGARTLPLTLGFDAVGTIEAIGSDVTSVSIGDRVCLMTDIMEPGTAADLVLAREHNLAKVPIEMPDPIAAGLPLAGLTALQGWSLAGIEEGQSVLVHGGSGGVGHLAIQLAKLRGATVYATSSRRNLDLLDDLGADHPIDYQATPPARFIGSVDVVLDTQGGAVAAATLRAMKPGATLVSIVGFQPEEAEARADVRIERMLVEPRADELATLVGLVADHRLRVIVHDTTPLDRFVDALQALHAGHTAGKRIIAVA
ncbi:MAG: NADP-dependent oxidoreductase [Demequinaceae bacterium]|nr:NADP-dependent oxidoreductase [Demequinaceae bacterium]